MAAAFSTAQMESSLHERRTGQLELVEEGDERRLKLTLRSQCQLRFLQHNTHVE